MGLTVSYNNKKLEINVKETNLFTRFVGLMFKSKKTRSLLFDFNDDKRWSIHSLFVFSLFWLYGSTIGITFLNIKLLNRLL